VSIGVGVQHDRLNLYRLFRRSIGIVVNRNVQ